MSFTQKFKNSQRLEDEAIYAVLARILPHLEGLSYDQAERVLVYARAQVGKAAKLDAKSIQKICEEFQHVSCGQDNKNL